MSRDELTAVQLSELTGVPAGTLRVWEARYGFPDPHRGPGGRKRYARADVDRVASVLAQRGRGVSLVTAIERIKAEPPRRLRSVFAALRETRPDLQVHVLTKPVLLAFSYAVEDELSSRAPGGLLGASFQHERHFRASERRWRGLARSADMSIVLADFAETRRPSEGPIEVALAPGHPLEREWTLIVNSPTVSACLAGAEVPEAVRVPDERRRFETIWSFDPAVVAAATEVFAGLVADAAPDLDVQIPPELLEPPSRTAAELRLGADLSLRAVSYVAAMDGRPGGRA